MKKLKLDKYLVFFRDYSHNVLPNLLMQGKKFDFAFIDGGHKFDDIFLDFYYIDLLLNTSGYVLFHDTWLSSTQDVVSWIQKNKLNYKEINIRSNTFFMFQKLGQDRRAWHYHKEFFTFKSRIINLIKKI